MPKKAAKSILKRKDQPSSKPSVRFNTKAAHKTKGKFSPRRLRNSHEFAYTKAKSKSQVVKVKARQAVGGVRSGGDADHQVDWRAFHHKTNDAVEYLLTPERTWLVEPFMHFVTQRLIVDMPEDLPLPIRYVTTFEANWDTTGELFHVTRNDLNSITYEEFRAYLFLVKFVDSHGVVGLGQIIIDHDNAEIFFPYERGANTDEVLKGAVREIIRWNPVWRGRLRPRIITVASGAQHSNLWNLLYLALRASGYQQARLKQMFENPATASTLWTRAIELYYHLAPLVVDCAHQAGLHNFGNLALSNTSDTLKTFRQLFNQCRVRKPESVRYWLKYLLPPDQGAKAPTVKWPSPVAPKWERFVSTTNAQQPAFCF